MKTKSLKFLATGAVALIISACEITPPDNRTQAEIERDENGSFLGLNNALGGQDESLKGNTIMINAYLWQGALDTLSVMPIDTAEPQAGFIQTEWVDTQKTDEQIRLSALILSGDLMASGVRVNVHKRIYENNSWNKVQASRTEINTVTNAILQRARELRLSDKQNQ